MFPLTPTPYYWDWVNRETHFYPHLAQRMGEEVEICRRGSGRRWRYWEGILGKWSKLQRWMEDYQCKGRCFVLLRCGYVISRVIAVSQFRGHIIWRLNLETDCTVARLGCHISEAPSIVYFHSRANGGSNRWILQGPISSRNSICGHAEANKLAGRVAELQ